MACDKKHCVKLIFQVTEWVNPSFDCVSKSTLPMVLDSELSGYSKSSGENQKILCTKREKTLQPKNLNSTRSHKRIRGAYTDQILGRHRQNSPSNHSDSWVDEYRPQSQVRA